MNDSVIGGPAVAFHPHRMEDVCIVAPSPELKDKLIDQFDKLRARAGALVARNLALDTPTHVGFNDGVIYPGTYYPVGTAAGVVQRAAADRAPLRGVVRVIVVLVDFSDKAMAADAADRFRNLFFSTGVLANGSVREYFSDVSGGLIDIQGEVVGPYRMPQTIAAYAGSDNGTQGATPNARTLASDALTAANPHVNFSPYDNDGNGYVDAYIVVHAGRGAEETGAAGDIWSHKWVLPSERTVDGTKVYAYLTIPEDAKIGVSAHEIGHLVFGWPDLYDTDNSSEGIGNWCLMAGGSWGGGGDRPAHPSAWCKAGQGWISVVTQTTNADVTIADVKTGKKAYRLWKDGGGGNEYFLVENRQQTGYDASLPGGGLLIWHIDEATPDNRNEAHYKVALVQADGLKQLEGNVNRGDAGDPYPGSTGNSSFTGSSNPSSKSYAGAETHVGVTGIPASASAMTVRLNVRQTIVKPFKDAKEIIKEGKEIVKEVTKERPKEIIKERPKELIKDGKELGKDIIKERPKEVIKEGPKEFIENPFDDFRPPFGRTESEPPSIDQRLAALEQAVQSIAATLQPAAPQGGEPFIGSDERPVLGNAVGPDLGALRSAMESGDPQAKNAFDTLPPA